MEIWIGCIQTNIIPPAGIFPAKSNGIERDDRQNATFKSFRMKLAANVRHNSTIGFINNTRYRTCCMWHWHRNNINTKHQKQSKFNGEPHRVCECIQYYPIECRYVCDRSLIDNVFVVVLRDCGKFAPLLHRLFNALCTEPFLSYWMVTMASICYCYCSCCYFIFIFSNVPNSASNRKHRKSDKRSTKNHF